MAVNEFEPRKIGGIPFGKRVGHVIGNGCQVNIPTDPVRIIAVQ